MVAMALFLHEPLRPDRTFPNFRAFQYIDRRIFCGSEMSIDGFLGFGLVKCSVGSVLSKKQRSQAGVGKKIRRVDK